MKKLKDAKSKIRKGAKKAAAVGTAGALLFGVLLPAGHDAINPAEAIDAETLNPTPIVMDIDEFTETEEEGEPEPKEEKKLGFFKRLKLAILGFFGAIGAWLTAKVPWRKIFNKRNFSIAALLIIVGLAAYYGLPRVWEDCPWGRAA